MNSELESFPDQVNNEEAKRGNRRDVAISPDRNEPIVKRNRPRFDPPAILRNAGSRLCLGLEMSRLRMQTRIKSCH